MLGVSTSGYYAWLKREPSARAKANAEVLDEIREIHEWSDGTYGAIRVTEESEETRPAPDLVDRDFTATGPDQRGRGPHP